MFYLHSFSKDLFGNDLGDPSAIYYSGLIPLWLRNYKKEALNNSHKEYTFSIPGYLLSPFGDNLTSLTFPHNLVVLSLEGFYH